ncbi:hypothetical protein FGG08_006904 [Glutinoglossum americanum]|uniref:Cytochrome oxidase c assembly-domain-containing protein n=1 Tax=Glutinoglossum americanum TaxID=1670608 RepID=A0A9P8KUH3_9PEZI|nr:hypothetical protein FGG08_006904 [Glutinoglossum americanum]
MPRSAADATRFTATAPHAHSKSSRIPSASPTMPSPPNRQETPQQKVARLRAAALKAKEGNISAFDKVVVRGRVWADRAHRFVTLSLVGLTGLSAIYATVAITDMLLHNRRKKREYFAQQSHLLSVSIADAAAAEALGTATEPQIALLKREREHAAYLEELERQKNPGVVERTKEWLFSGLKRDEGEEAGSKDGTPAGEGMAYDRVLAQVQALNAEQETEKEEGRMLDRPGEASSPSPSSTPSLQSEPSSSSSSRSWTSWLGTRR